MPTNWAKKRRSERIWWIRIARKVFVFSCGLKSTLPSPPHHDHLVESEVSKPVAADRSIVVASRNHSDYLRFLLAPSIANGYTYSSSQTMLPHTL